MVLQFIKSSFSNMKSALARARSLLGGKISSLFQGKMDEETFEQLERSLYEADFGVKTAAELTEKIRALHKSNPSMKKEEYLKALRESLVDMLGPQPVISTQETSPQVVLIVGVNGNGKTTSVAKLAHFYTEKGKKVLVAAADTFRAAAIEQLETWAERLKVDIVKGHPNSDPAAVAFDAVQAAKSRGCDLVLIDTAGRLHTKIPLMQELEKIKRSCQKAIGVPPNETYLVLDATTGQNAIDQAKQFHKATPLTGLILTKLDGTAKGGIVFAIHRELGIPIRFIGLGEGLDDLQPFDAQSFVSNLFEA
ncbi:MAG: signal recognition particle-docking protein FtsY [Parachlamydia sp.]|jgi:fused signal recognition particle receptor|nr:signal recognition particle-docking protein FtsY [Parachlamydia sp.]